MQAVVLAQYEGDPQGISLHDCTATKRKSSTPVELLPAMATPESLVQESDGNTYVHGSQNGNSDTLESVSNTNAILGDGTLDVVQKDASSSEADGYAFHFDLPKEGLAIHSAAIVDGKPEIQFAASPKVPTTTEEDFATVFRVVSEGKRPEFYFIGMPFGHPFLGRQFNDYRPHYLRGTSIGKLLFDADWKMKCLHIGAQSDESKSVFWSWKSKSNLEGLATWPDFPPDAKPSGGSVIMSCESVKVQKDENSLAFLEDPKITITDQTNTLYTKYISDIFPNIAYHDEPLFLKMQELVKMILVAEWFKERGVKISQKWMSAHTTKSPETGAPALEGDQCVPQAINKVKKPPHDMIPKPTIVNRPSSDVTVRTREAEQYRHLSDCGIKWGYGYLDHWTGETVIYSENGIPLLQQKAARFVIERSTTVGEHQVGEIKFNFGLPLPPSVPLVSLPTEDSEGCHSEVVGKAVDKFLAMISNTNEEINGPYGPMLVRYETDKALVKHGGQLTITKTVHPCAPLAPMKETVVVKGSVDDYDMLYSTYADPNTPIGMTEDGELIIPDVGSWSELHSETVPWPQAFQLPYSGIGEPSPGGGVSTRNITEVPTRAPRKEPVAKESRWVDQYRQNGDRIVVQGMRSTSQGAIRWASGVEFAEISQTFKGAWHSAKGPCPSVAHVFVVTNTVLQQRWTYYQQQLQQRRHKTTVEQYFHGTSMTCNIISTQQLCRYASCGVCGISSEGLNPKHIQKNITFQRFGSGFYLAPHSSKCHDYTQGSNGYRAMLLCDVLPGNKYQLKKTDQSLQGPPPGYDSIYGQVGQDLNYPEIVLHESEAVLPRYIILYEKDGTAHPLRK